MKSPCSQSQGVQDHVVACRGGGGKPQHLTKRVDGAREDEGNGQQHHRLHCVKTGERDRT